MTEAVRVEGLCKRYDAFELENVGFSVEAGTIAGLVGENGAGKTTTIKAMLGLIRPDAGSVTLLGRPARWDDWRARTHVAYVPDDCCFPTVLCARDVARMMRGLCPDWRDERFDALLKRFGLEARKPVKDYSKGMRMKLSIACALAREPRLLILDEPTGGLDPVARDDLLDLLQQFVEDERNAVLFSTHITGDLDKIADSVTFLHAGRCALTATRGELLDTAGIARLSAAQLAQLRPGEALRVRRERHGCEALVRDRAAVLRAHPDWIVEGASVEEIMLMIAKGEEA